MKNFWIATVLWTLGLGCLYTPNARAEGASTGNQEISKPKHAPLRGAEEQVVESVSCTKDQDHRRLELQTDGPGCAGLYTKGRENRVIARFHKGVEKCRTKLKEMRTKFEGLGFTCQ